MPKKQKPKHDLAEELGEGGRLQDNILKVMKRAQTSIVLIWDKHQLATITRGREVGSRKHVIMKLAEAIEILEAEEVIELPDQPKHFSA